MPLSKRARGAVVWAILAWCAGSLFFIALAVRGCLVEAHP